jgi:hypothetical protein
VQFLQQGKLFVLFASLVHFYYHILLLHLQVRHVFGGAHYAPHALFVRFSKMHNNGHVLLFLRPSECRMGGFALNVLEECTASKMFLDSKKFH